MTDKTHYIIQKQILDIRHGKDGNAFAMQTEMRRRYKSELIPLLEKICDELCPPDRLVKIEKLVVELLPMTDQQYKAKWTEAAEKAFRKSLLQAIAQSHDPQHKNVKTLSRADADLQLLKTFLHTGNLPWSYIESGNRSLETLFGALIKNEAEAVRRLLKECLKQEAFIKRLCHQFSSSVIAELLSLLQSGHTADAANCYRSLHGCFTKIEGFKDRRGAIFLLKYHSLRQLAGQAYRGEKEFIRQTLTPISQAWNIPYRDLLDTLIKAVKPESSQNRSSSLPGILEILYREPAEVSAAKKVAQDTLKNQARKEKVEVTLLRELQQLLKIIEEIENAAVGEKAALYKDFENRSKQCLRYLEKDGTGSRTMSEGLAADIKQLLREAERIAHTTKQQKTLLKKRLTQFINLMERDAAGMLNGHEPSPEFGRNGEAYDTFKRFLEAQEKNGQHIPKQLQSIEEPEAVYLQNAGLIIVWPFFKELFEGLNFTEKERFAGEKKQHRAVHLLQYLASGEENCNEYLLGLNKLLCGLELSAPVPLAVNLTKSEKAAAEALIKAVTGHWPAMKNTSVAGFREAFLMREGKLSRNGNGWLLQVAQKSYDVLMNKLPWGISLVKLPWMPEALFVEW